MMNVLPRAQKQEEMPRNHLRSPDGDAGMLPTAVQVYYCDGTRPNRQMGVLVDDAALLDYGEGTVSQDR